MTDTETQPQIPSAIISQFIKHHTAINSADYTYFGVNLGVDLNISMTLD